MGIEAACIECMPLRIILQKSIWFVAKLALWRRDQLTCLREMVVQNGLTWAYILGFLAWNISALSAEPNFTLQPSGSETVGMPFFLMWLLASVIMWLVSYLDLMEVGNMLWSASRHHCCNNVQCRTWTRVLTRIPYLNSKHSQSSPEKKTCSENSFQTFKTDQKSYHYSCFLLTT